MTTISGVSELTTTELVLLPDVVGVQPGRVAVLIGRTRAHLATPLYRNAYALMASTVITAVLGVVYWALAARLYSPREVGRASAAVSMMLLLSGLAQANQHNILPRLIPLAGASAGRLIARAYLTSGAIAAVAATAFVVGFGHSTFLAGFGGPLVDAWFVAAVVTWCIFTLQDAVLTGFRAAMWVPVENTLFALAKIVLLVTLASTMPRLGLFTAWTLPVAVSIAPITWLVYRRLVPRHREMDLTSRYLTAGRSTTRFVAADAIGGVLQLAGTMLLPALVADRLGLEEAGWFYAAWIVGSAFDSLLLNVTASFTVEAAHDEASLRALVRKVARMWPFLVGACAVIAAASSSLLGLMGSSYAHHAGSLLQLMCAGMVMRAIVLVAVALARVRRRLVALVAVQSSLCVALLGGSLLLSGLGLAGIGVAYAATQTLVGLAVLPGLLRFVFGSDVTAQPRPVVRAVPRLHRARQLVRAPRASILIATTGAFGFVAAVVGLTETDEDRATSLGLAAALPPAYWVGLVTLVVVAVVAVLHRPRAWLLIPIVLALVVVCEGAASIVERFPRFYTAWLHVGFVDYISTHGSTDPGLDARFSWPGMFGATALLVKVAGLHDAMPLLRWAPPVLTAACLPAVWSIACWATRDARTRWLTVVLFVLGDWVGQDYLAPQAVVLVGALAVVAMALRTFGAEPDGRGLRSLGRPPRPVAVGPAARPRAAVAVVAVIVLSIVVAHQLTPVLLIVDLAAIVALRRTTFTMLPALLGVLFLVWLSVGAEPFWAGHRSLLFGGVGSVGGNVGANVGGRATGDPGHLLAVHIRVALTLLTFAAAAVGWLVWRDARRWVVAVLAFAPFTAVGIQAYGGEAALRSYLFALPFLALLVAKMLTPRGLRWRQVATTVGGCALTVVMALGFVIVRWSNERFEAVGLDERTALAWTYAHAPAGVTLVNADQALPWRYAGLTTYQYDTTDNSMIDSADEAYSAMTSAPSGIAYFISTEEERAYGVQMAGRPAGWLADIDADLAHRLGVTLAFTSGSASVYEYSAPGRGPA